MNKKDKYFQYNIAVRQNVQSDPSSIYRKGFVSIFFLLTLCFTTTFIASLSLHLQTKLKIIDNLAAIQTHLFHQATILKKAQWLLDQDEKSWSWMVENEWVTLDMQDNPGIGTTNAFTMLIFFNEESRLVESYQWEEVD